VCLYRPNSSKDGKDSLLPRKLSGVQFPRPPPWAYPTWNHPMQHPNTEQLLRSASQAIDLALAQSLDSKLKIVDVTLSVQIDGADSDYTSLPSSPWKRSGATDRHKDFDGNDRSYSAVGGLAAEVRSGYYLEDSLLNDTSAEQEARRPGGNERAHCLAGAPGWINVVLTSVAGLNMDDIEQDPHPRRSKIHYRVPSTVAMAEVTVSFGGDVFCLLQENNLTNRSIVRCLCQS
jgi:hypothetical protein